MTKEGRMIECRKEGSGHIRQPAANSGNRLEAFVIWAWSFLRHSSFVIRHLSLVIPSPWGRHSCLPGMSKIEGQIPNDERSPNERMSK
jgi:hypothetical protein